jgi:hypothetical protein
VRVLSFVLPVTTPRYQPHTRRIPLLPADLTAAPEIALLAAPYVPAPACADARPTIGSLARELRLIASQPQRWWDKVRFGKGRYERIDLGIPGAWVMTLAPGDAGVYCDCDLMVLVAGEATEESVAVGGAVTTVLRPGRVRVHGQGQLHQIRAGEEGFAVTLHVRGSA